MCTSVCAHPTLFTKVDVWCNVLSILQTIYFLLHTEHVSLLWKVFCLALLRNMGPDLKDYRLDPWPFTLRAVFLNLTPDPSHQRAHRIIHRGYLESFKVLILILEVNISLKLLGAQLGTDFINIRPLSDPIVFSLSPFLFKKSSHFLCGFQESHSPPFGLKEVMSLF